MAASIFGSPRTHASQLSCHMKHQMKHESIHGHDSRLLHDDVDVSRTSWGRVRSYFNAISALHVDLTHLEIGCSVSTISLLDREKGRMCNGTVFFVPICRVSQNDHPTRTTCQSATDEDSFPPPTHNSLPSFFLPERNPLWRQFQPRLVQHNGDKRSDGRCGPFHQRSVLLSTMRNGKEPLACLGR